MRIVLFCFLLVIINSSSFSQVLISSGGQPFSNNQSNINWSIGEVFIKHYSNNKVKEGFHQSNNEIITSLIPEFDKRINVYPNPFYSELNVQTDLNHIHLTVDLYSSSGIKIFSKYLTNSFDQIETSSLVNGVYWLRISNARKVLKTIKLIKK